MKRLTVTLLAMLPFLMSILTLRAQEWNIIERGFLYDTPEPPTCHAATLTEVADGEIIAAFFGGTHEGHPDSNIWMCRYDAQKRSWSAPKIIAEGLRTDHTRAAFEYEADCNMVRKPCYNPVIYRVPGGEIVLDYKIGSNMQDWTGWEIRSRDGGWTWTNPRPLTDDPAQRHLRLGPIKNKPLINNGRIIAGSSTEVTYESWKVHFEISDDEGRTWQKREVECDSILCIQPAILNLGDGHLKALCRTRNRFIAETESFDNGDSWTRMELNGLRHNNSGIDATTLHDGTHLLICNDTGDSARRSPLSLFASRDGSSWTKIFDLETDDGLEYSYPAIVQISDSSVLILYTWHREKIAYVRLAM